MPRLLNAVCFHLKESPSSRLGAPMRLRGNGGERPGGMNAVCWVMRQGHVFEARTGDPTVSNLWKRQCRFPSEWAVLSFSAFRSCWRSLRPLRGSLVRIVRSIFQPMNSRSGDVATSCNGPAHMVSGALRVCHESAFKCNVTSPLDSSCLLRISQAQSASSSRQLVQEALHKRAEARSQTESLSMERVIAGLKQLKEEMLDKLSSKVMELLQ